jgi:hypothetical protein
MQLTNRLEGFRLTGEIRPFAKVAFRFRSAFGHALQNQNIVSAL